MLFIIIGVSILIAGIIVMHKTNNPVLFAIGLGAALILPCFGMSSISGYEEPVLQETYELKPVYEPDTYIIEDGSGMITCRHIIKSEHPEAIESYGKYTYNEDTELVIAEKGSKPIMKKYHLKARKTIWTFAIDCDKTKYVFCVPEENIEKWQNKHVN